MRYCFVLPRVGEDVIGGAEQLSMQIASRLKDRGHEVKILATCAKDNRTWENEHAAGEDRVFGVDCIRFPVDERDLETWVPLQIRLSEGLKLTLDEQLSWMKHSVNSNELYQYISDYADDFDAILFAPYMFGTTFWGSLIRPDKSYLIPCLHDEVYAYVDVIGSMFRQVSGCVFNAYPEMQLARSLYGDIPGGEVGLGFDPHDLSYVEGLEPYFEDEFPYLVYFGRKETGKNVQVAVDYFVAGKEKGTIAEEIKLVVAGGGSFDDLHRPEALSREDIIDIHRPSDREKHQLMRHAAALCQPSTNESFSIVLMEAWQLSTPVIVHSDCHVTRYHAIESGGGLYFRNENEFAGVVSELYNKESGEIAEAGKRYVEEVYNWDSVMDRFEAVMSDLLKEKNAAEPVSV